MNSFEKNESTSRRLHIDRKMAGILSVFAALGVCLVISIVIATDTLSALRAYATLQAHWTEARKEATFQLVHYLETQDQPYLARLDSALHLIHSATRVRNELLEPDTDRSFVRQHLLETHAVPADVDIMITAFERFHSLPDFDEAISQWIESDRLVSEMEALASDTREFMASGSVTSAIQQQRVAEVLSLDRELTLVQYKLAAALASGTRLLNTIILWVSSSLGCILLLTGGFLSFRFLKSIKTSHRAIEISEQRFRSLFEQNPNAVYSFTKDGRLMQGNEVLENMVGYSLEELKERTFDRLIKESELEKFNKHFLKALQGIPQTYETIGIHKNGEQIYVEITNLPIYVDDEIIGVYGVARDISVRKEAERKIREQLREKTHLLTEVHDRVKNNLALISSLIQLQREKLGSKDIRKYLDSTVSRIHSMAMVHERLYHTDTFSSIRMDEYVNELSETVRNLSNMDSQNYKLVINTEPVTLSINKAIPTGLLLNELLVNAFTFAFVGQNQGTVSVSLSQESDKIVLVVADDGVGFPDNFDLDAPRTLGMKLVDVLTRQLKATWDLQKERGTTHTIRFPVQNKVSKSA